MYGYIYKITNLINNKIYIGKHKSKFYDKNYYGSGIIIKRVIKKYGKENFSIEILHSCESNAELNEKEIYYIDLYKCRDSNIGYNMSKGGDGGNVGKNYFHHSQESYKKGVETRRRNGTLGYNGQKGKKSTKEHKEKISKSHKGKPAWNKGKHNVYSKELIEKMRIISRGKKQSKETIEKRKLTMIKNGTYRHSHTDEFKNRVSQKFANSITINKDGREKRIQKEDLESYLRLGYKKGLTEEHKIKIHSKSKRTLNRICITNLELNQCKYIKKEDLNTYINSGWIKGNYKNERNKRNG